MSNYYRDKTLEEIAADSQNSEKLESRVADYQDFINKGEQVNDDNVVHKLLSIIDCEDLESKLTEIFNAVINSWAIGETITIRYPQAKPPYGDKDAEWEPLLT
jgi:hypothetical protein